MTLTGLVLASMWWKKKISQGEMAEALWQICCDSAEDFCTKLRPQLEAEGFLSTTAEHHRFNLEAMQLHLWIITLVFGADGPILDLLHKTFINWDMTLQQGRASATVKQRFALYDQAFAQDEKLPFPRKLAEAALQCLLDRRNPIKSFTILSDVHYRLLSILQAVQKCRGRFNITTA
jgi:hypothetical protein